MVSLARHFTRTSRRPPGPERFFDGGEKGVLLLFDQLYRGGSAVIKNDGGTAVASNGNIATVTDVRSLNGAPGISGIQTTPSLQGTFNVDVNGYGALRLDNTDDKLELTFPDGLTNAGVYIFGRSGFWGEQGLSVPPGGTISIGPTDSPKGVTGVISSVGDIGGVVIIDRVLTDNEKTTLSEFFTTRGLVGIDTYLNAVIALSPKGLYASQPLYNGEQILYQDVAKTTPATAIGDPVGWRKDLSGQGLHATQGTSANRPILRQDSNGNWYLEYSGSHWFDVPGSASAWKFLHSTEGSVVAGARFGTTSNPDVAMYILASTDSSTRVGSLFFYEDRSEFARSNELRTSITRGVTGSFVVDDTTIDAIQPNANAVVLWNVDPDNVTPSNRASGEVDGVAVGGNNTKNNPVNTGSSTYDFKIGSGVGFSSGDSPLIGRDYGLWVDDAQLSGANLETVEDWLADRTGVPFA